MRERLDTAVLIAAARGSIDLPGHLTAGSEVATLNTTGWAMPTSALASFGSVVKAVAVAVDR